MSNYFLVNKDTNTIEVYAETALFCKYLFDGFVELSDIKDVGDIGFLLNELRYRGVLVFSLEHINDPQSYKIKTKTGASELVFDNLYAAIDYCKETKLTSAGDSYIKSTLMKNLTGKTKSAYGKSWEFITEHLDIKDYNFTIIV